MPIQILTGDINEIFLGNNEFHLWFCASSVLGLVLTINVMLVVALMGSIFCNISGICKDVVLTYAGFILFNDIRPTFDVLAGLAVSLIGSTYYIHDKIVE